MDNIRIVDEFVIINIIFNKNEVILANVEEWFNNFVPFIPVTMTGTKLTNHNMRKYNKRKFNENISREIEGSTNFSLSVHNGENTFLLRRKGLNASIICRLDKNIYQNIDVTIEDEINRFFIKHKGIVAYICSGKDDFFQNLKQEELYSIYGMSTNNLPKRKNTIGNFEIDIECFPGHKHYINEIWFGSCWLMWFGSEFYKYIPKEILTSFKNCYRNNFYNDSFVQIQLYESIWDYESKQNRERQWDFRKKVGIDMVSHRLMDIPALIENSDPTIEFFLGVFEHGGIKQVKIYYDSNGVNVAKSKANKYTIREYNNDGKEIWWDIKGL